MAYSVFISSSYKDRDLARDVARRVKEAGVMKMNYYPETDSLYIDLSSRPSVDSREVSDGVVLDYDAQGNLVGIDIDQASKKLEIKEIILSRLPGKVKQVA